MKTYQKSDGSLWAFDEDGSQDSLIDACIADGGAFKTEAEANVIRNPPLPEPTQQEIVNEKIRVMDAKILLRLNNMARTLRFESIATAIAASGLPVGEYRQEDGAKLHLWSARTWQKGEEILMAFLSGAREEPTWQEVESELPEYPII